MSIFPLTAIDGQYRCLYSYLPGGKMKRVAALMIWIVVLGGWLCAEQVWPQPLELFSARNIEFAGQGLKTSSGGYLISWKDWEQTTPLQQFRLTDANGNTIWQRALSPEIQSEQRWLLETGGDYILFFSKGSGFLHGYRLNQQGEHVWGEDGLQLTSCNLFREHSTGKLIADGSGGYIFLWAWAFDGIDEPTSYFLQHLDAQGGTAIVNGSTSYEFLQITEYGLAGPPDLFLLPDGGIICSYRLDDSVVIRRMLPNHSFSWTQTLSFGSAVWPTLTDTGDGCFNLVWHTPEAVMAMRYSYDFVAQWSQPLNLCGSTQGLEAASRKTVNCSDGKTLSAWLANGQLRMQRFGNDGVLECGHYGAPVMEGLSADASFTLLPDATGGCYVQVNDPDTETVRGQYISAQNQVLPQATVLAQGSPDAEVGSSSCTLFPSGLRSYYHERSATSSGIRMQGMDPAGSPAYPDGGPAVVTGNRGKASLPCAAAAGGKVFCAWLDFPPEAPGVLTPCQISYQVADPLGSLLLSQPGSLFAESALQSVSTLMITGTDEGQGLVCWVEQSTPARMRAQLIDSSGNQLWEPGGRIISPDTGSSGVIKIGLTHAHGAVYIVWLEYGTQAGYIRAQKVSGGQTVWEPGGRPLISNNNGYDLYWKGLDEDYLIYGYGWYENLISDAYVYRFNSEGGAQPGFAQYSYENYLGGDGISGYDGIQIGGCKAGSDRLYVFFDLLEWEIEWYNYYSFAQAISSTGEKLWGNPGIPGLVGGKPYTIGNDLYCVTGSYTRSVNKYNAAGGLEWSFQLPYNNVAVQQLSASWDNRLVGISGPSYFYGSSRLLYFCFDDTGWNTLPGDHYLETSDLALYQSLCRLNDDLYVIWGSRIGYGENELAHIRLQRLNSHLVGNDDPAIPAVDAFRLEAQGPNPFSTKVAFSVVLPERGEAGIAIYNLRGQKVRTVFEGNLEKGITGLSWDGRDERGIECADGVYVCRARLGKEARSFRMVKLR
jgi:hypothetical protein